jgi:hypothetical protein
MHLTLPDFGKALQSVATSLLQFALESRLVPNIYPGGPSWRDSAELRFAASLLK